MQKVRYGIVGFGRFAERFIAPAIQSSGSSELVALQKRSLAAAREKAKAFGIPLAFDTADDLVRHPDVDAVFITSANSAHCRETIAAAEAKKHVLVEKPMALTTAEAERMIDACKKKKVRLMVGHMVRFSPLVRRLKEIVHSGAIGHVVAVRAEFIYDARRSQRSWLTDPAVAGGGPVFDIGVHCLDTMRYVLEDRIISISSTLQPRPTKERTESTGQIALQFADGTLGSIYCSYTSPIRRTFIEVIGSEAILAAPDFTLGGIATPLSITQREEKEEGVTAVESITVPNLYVEEISHFSDCILNDKDPAIPGEVGLENQRVLDEVMKRGEG